MINPIKLITLFIGCILLYACKSTKEIQEPEPILKPKSNFVITNHNGLVYINDSSANAITYKLNFGDESPIIHDTIKKISPSMHLYKLRESIANYEITYEVFNKIGQSDVKIKKVSIPAITKDTINIPIDTIEYAGQIGYINTEGQLEGQLNDQGVNYKSDANNFFAGSNFFNDMGNVYYFSAVFSHGFDKCTPIDNYTVIVPIGQLGLRYLENKPSSMRYEILRDSLKIGNKYNFTYTTSKKQSNGINIINVHNSKKKAKLTDIQEVNISPSLYKGVYTKGLDVIFILQNTEYINIIDNTSLTMKTDLIFKLRLLVDNRPIQGIEAMGIIGFCY